MRLRNGKVVEIVLDAPVIVEVMTDDHSSRSAGSNEVEGNDRSHSSRSQSPPPHRNGEPDISSHPREMDQSFALMDPGDTRRSLPDSIPPNFLLMQTEAPAIPSIRDYDYRPHNPEHHLSMVPYPTMTEGHLSTAGTYSEVTYENADSGIPLPSYDSSTHQNPSFHPHDLPHSSHGLTNGTPEGSHEFEDDSLQLSSSRPRRSNRGHPRTNHQVNGNHGPHRQHHTRREIQQPVAPAPWTTELTGTTYIANDINEPYEQSIDPMEHSQETQTSLGYDIPAPGTGRLQTQDLPNFVHGGTFPSTGYDQTNPPTPHSRPPMRRRGEGTRSSSRVNTRLQISTNSPSMIARPHSPSASSRAQASDIPPYSMTTPHSPPRNTANPFTSLSPTNPFQTNDPPWSPGAASLDLQASRQARLPEHPSLPSSGSYRHQSFGSGFEHGYGLTDELEHDLDEMDRTQLGSQNPRDGRGRRARRRAHRRRRPHRSRDGDGDGDGDQHAARTGDGQEHRHGTETLPIDDNEEEADLDIEMGGVPTGQAGRGPKRKRSSSATGRDKKR